MKNIMRIFVPILGVVTLLAFIPAAQAAEKEAHRMTPAHAAMDLHHMHTMIDHGLTMALQGSNLVMLSEMKMAPGIDEITLAHGNEMIADGKAMVLDMLSGEHMKKMHKMGQANTGLMTYTHELANASLKVISDLEDMKMAEMTSPADMKMHHMHIALNHALEMAADGANLVMMGQMKMAKGVDRHTIDHGRKMIADGRKLWKDIMGSASMAEMHKEGMTPEASAMMGGTHKLADDEKQVLDLLANMPEAQ